MRGVIVRLALFSSHRLTADRRGMLGVPGQFAPTPRTARGREGARIRRGEAIFPERVTLDGRAPSQHGLPSQGELTTTMKIFGAGKRVALAVSLLLIPSCGEGGDEPGELTPEQVLEAAADRLDETTSFAFLLEHENGFTPIVGGLLMERAEGQVAGPDRMQAEVRARVGPINVNVRLVIVPEGSWMTNPLTQQWEPQTIEIAQFFDPATGVTAIMRGLTGAQITGTESVGGVVTHRIEANVDSGALDALLPGVIAGSDLGVRTWVGVEDSLVRRIEIQGAIEPGDNPALVRRLTLSEFGGTFSITPPQ
jgi:hypothetical protein